MNEKISVWEDARMEADPIFRAVIHGVKCEISSASYQDYWTWKIELPEKLCSRNTVLTVNGSAVKRADAEKWAENAAKYARMQADGRTEKSDG